LIAANLYYAQPLTGLIGAALDIPPAAIGMLVALTQVGYGLGLVLIVPLGDLLENRRLTVFVICLDAVALLAMSLAHTSGLFLFATFVVGIGGSSVSILLPFAAHLATDIDRGRVIGTLTSGLMLGIMLARPLASFETYYFGWRVVFAASALGMIALAVILTVAMPQRRPRSSLGYFDMLRSLLPLLRDVPVLRRRAACHAALFASFSLFWTAAPLLLAGPLFALTQRGIALFALAGTGGVIVAPAAGWIADKGWTKPATGFAIGAVLIGFVAAFIGGQIRSMAMLVAAAALIDVGVVTNFVLSQRSIYAPRPESRSRIGGLFTAIFFTGGAVGSALASVSMIEGGWQLTTYIGMGFAGIALLLYYRCDVVKRSPVISPPHNESRSRS
jgi:predicted MFS family arabinose efflux permease